MRRREFFALVAGMLLADEVRSQTTGSATVGFLGAEKSELAVHRVAAFLRGLSEQGFEDGRNVSVHYRWAESKYESLPVLAGELVELHPQVIVSVGGVRPALAAKSATNTIPIVFQGGFDPVAIGLVSSINRPGGNITGVTTLNGEIIPKSLELLRELLPESMGFGLVIDGSSPNGKRIEDAFQTAASTLNLQIEALSIRSEADAMTLFASGYSSKFSALILSNDSLILSLSKTLAELTLRYRVIAISPFRDFTDAGGLMSYGSSSLKSHELIGVYAGRIIKGERPDSLPVLQGRNIELVVNIKAARLIGVSLPASIVVRANEVIE